MLEFVFKDTASFVTALAKLSCDGRWFLPRWTKEYQLSADAYLTLRDQWEKDGIAVLDFDGELHLTRRFARASYNITKARAALCHKKEDFEQIFLLGPVDVLSLRRKDELWTMRLCQPTEVSRYVRGELAGADSGVLQLQAAQAEEVMEKTEELTGKEGQKAVLEEFLDLFFGRRVRMDA